MTREEEIRQIQKASAQCWKIRKDLLLDGHALDSPGVLMMDERIWELMFRLLVLTEGEAAAAKLLSELGMH